MNMQPKTEARIGDTEFNGVGFRFDKITVKMLHFPKQSELVAPVS